MLVDIAVTMGAPKLPHVFEALRDSLSRGFHVHVLVRAGQMLSMAPIQKRSAALRSPNCVSSAFGC